MQFIHFAASLANSAQTFNLPVFDKCRVLRAKVEMTVARGAVDINIKRGSTVVAKCTLGATDTGGVLLPVTSAGADRLVFDSSNPLVLEINGTVASNFAAIIELDPFLIGSK